MFLNATEENYWRPQEMKCFEMGSYKAHFWFKQAGKIFLLYFMAARYNQLSSKYADYLVEQATNPILKTDLQLVTTNPLGTIKLQL